MILLQASELIDSGDGRYRTHEPGRFLGKLPGITSIECSPQHRLFPKLARQADILVLPFYHRGDFFPLIEERRSQGKATVFETNDYYLNMQPWNPIARLWYNPDVQAEHLEYVRRCDAVQTSTPRLAAHWSAEAKKVAVFPNQLSEIQPLPKKQPRALTLGWGGSQGHLADWYAFAPYLQSWLDAHPNVHLAIMSHRLAREFLTLPKERYSFFEAGSLQDYYRFLTSLDIGLAPLLPTEYNRCRSDVKFLEYAAHGVVGVYANLDPYRESVKHGVTGFLFDKPEGCIATLDALVDDASLLESVRLNAYQYVTEKRLLASHVEERIAFYNSLLNYVPNKNSLADELMHELTKATERDENYFRLELGEVENKLLEHLKSEPSDSSVAKLNEILEAAPDYVFTYEVLGRTLNHLRRPKESVDILEKGLRLQAKNTRIISELGRAYFLLGDDKSSRLHLEHATTLDPSYLPGWFYLLNFMRVKPQSDQSTIVERARLNHPKSYVLSFLIARLYEPSIGFMCLKETLQRMQAELSDLELQESEGVSVLAIKEIPSSFHKSTEYLELLKVAVSVYPLSTRLAHLLGLAYRYLGDTERSFKELCRANELARVARHFKDEFKEGDETHFFWEIANELTKHTD